MVAVSVIVPARDASATLPRTLEALAAQDLDEPYEVIVVDDASTDGTADAAERATCPVTLVRERGVGPGPARNSGAAAASGDVLAFTDADCFPAPGWLREGVRAVADADLVQGRVEPDPASAYGPFDRSVTVDAERGLYETANLIVSRTLFERLGGFEDWLPARIGKPLAEDLWFGWRARRAGARTAFSESAVVRHAVFERGPAEYVAERARLVYFPAIAAKMPELRRTFFFRGRFLNERSAAFDAAFLGAAAAARTRSPRPLLAALPYARLAYHRSRAFGRRAPLVATADLAADAVGLAALVAGSIRSRSLLL